MARLIEPGGPSAEQRLEREVEFLAGVVVGLRDLTPQERAELADQHAEAAKGCMDAALSVDGPARLTFLRLSGQHATKAQIYGAAA